MIRALLLLGLVASASACAPPPLDTNGTDDSGSDAPSIRITFPVSSTDVVYCSTFMVSVDIENFVLSPEHYGGDDVDGEGHWHLLDGDTTLKATADEWAFIPADMALSNDDHVLKAILVGNKHQPISPEVSWIAEITVNNDAVDDPLTTDVYEGCLGGGGGGTGY